MNKKSTFVMTEAQIESLAAERTSGLIVSDELDRNYLRALISGVQAKTGPKRSGRRLDNDSQLAAVEAVAVPFYAAVLRGVMTPDIALDASLEAAEVQIRNRERNRRATFARTAKSVLVSWISLGGDVRTIDPATVTKSELWSAVTAQRAENRPRGGRIEKAQEAILAAVAREGPDVARMRLEAVIEALQAAIDALPVEPEHHESTVIRTRVGQPTFREAPRVLNRAGA